MSAFQQAFLASYAGQSEDASESGPPQAPNHQALSDAVDKLKFFLATAPGSFTPESDAASSSPSDTGIDRFQLPTGDAISCVLWKGLFHITGTDIVRALNFRFLAFGRPVKNVKKFEEGIFSDLRNLKAGTDATLEEPKSDFLELLFHHNCIRTQKKQKVFYWFSVPHDRLFLDALDRDLKREKLGLEATTQAVAEPAASFVFDASVSLYDQFARSQPNEPVPSQSQKEPVSHRSGHKRARSVVEEDSTSRLSPDCASRNNLKGGSLLGAFSLFEGSPLYKQRRRHPSAALSNSSRHLAHEDPAPSATHGTQNICGPTPLSHFSERLPLDEPLPSHSEGFTFQSAPTQITSDPHSYGPINSFQSLPSIHSYPTVLPMEPSTSGSLSLTTDATRGYLDTGDRPLGGDPRAYYAVPSGPHLSLPQPGPHLHRAWSQPASCPAGDRDDAYSGPLFGMSSVDNGSCPSVDGTLDERHLFSEERRRHQRHQTVDCLGEQPFQFRESYKKRYITPFAVPAPVFREPTTATTAPPDVSPSGDLAGVTPPVPLLPSQHSVELQALFPP